MEDQYQPSSCVCATDAGETDREADAERQIAIELSRQQGWVIVGGTAFLLHVSPSQRVFGFGELDVHVHGDPFAHAHGLVEMLSSAFPYRAFRAVPTGTGLHQTVRVVGRSQVIADITAVETPTPFEVCMGHPLFRGCLVVERAQLVRTHEAMVADPNLWFRRAKDEARLLALTQPSHCSCAKVESRDASSNTSSVEQRDASTATADAVGACRQDASVETEETLSDIVRGSDHVDELRRELEDLRSRLEVAQNELLMQNLSTVVAGEDSQLHDRLSGQATPRKASTNKKNKKNKKKNKCLDKKNDGGGGGEEVVEEEKKEEVSDFAIDARVAWTVELEKRTYEQGFEKGMETAEKTMKEIKAQHACARNLANAMIDRARVAEKEVVELKERLSDFKDVANLLMQHVVDLNQEEASCVRLIPLVETAFPLCGTMRVSSAPMVGESRVLFVNQFASDFIQLTDIVSRTQHSVLALFHDCMRDTLADPHSKSIAANRCLISVRLTGKCNIHAPEKEEFYGPQHPMRHLFRAETASHSDASLEQRLANTFEGVEPSLGKLLMEPYFAVERDYLDGGVTWPVMLDFRICLRIDCTGFLTRITL